MLMSPMVCVLLPLQIVKCYATLRCSCIVSLMWNVCSDTYKFFSWASYHLIGAKSALDASFNTNQPIFTFTGCRYNLWGFPFCQWTCPVCYNGGICDDVSGRCVCPPGFTGGQCEQGIYAFMYILL